LHDSKVLHHIVRFKQLNVYVPAPLQMYPIEKLGDRTKAQTTKAHTTIPHRQNRTVINAHATKARTDNSTHGQLRARTNTHMYKCAYSQYFKSNILLIRRYVHAMKISSNMQYSTRRYISQDDIACRFC
jgi:hypothetical protein